MDIIYLEYTSERREITLQQAENLGDYIKRYIDQGNIIKEEIILRGDLFYKIFYKQPNQTHQDILNAELTPDTKKLVVREIENFGDYMLEKDFFYDGQGQSIGSTNTLFDPNNILIATENIINGVTQYEYSSSKEYYDLDIYPDGPVFISEFDENGSFVEIYYPNEDIEPDGQESEVFSNSSADLARVMARTGISQDLMDYYLIPDVTPTF